MQMTPIISKSSISKMTNELITKGDKQALKDATSPRGCLEHVVNFFTFGAVKEEKKALYLSIIKQMTTKLEIFESGNDSYSEKDSKMVNLDKLPEMDLKLNGFDVKLKRSESNANKLDINVSKKEIIGNGVKQHCAEIDANLFKRVCHAIIIRTKLNLEPSEKLLTETGNIDLRYENLSYKKINNIAFSTDEYSSDFSGSTLAYSYMENCILDKVIFSNNNASHLTIVKSSCREMLFEKSIVEKMQVIFGDWYGAKLSELQGSRVQFTSVDFIENLINNVKFPDSVFRKCGFYDVVSDDFKLKNNFMSDCWFERGMHKALNFNDGKFKNVKFTNLDGKQISMENCRTQNLVIDNSRLEEFNSEGMLVHSGVINKLSAPGWNANRTTFISSEINNSDLNTSTFLESDFGDLKMDDNTKLEDVTTENAFMQHSMYLKFLKHDALPGKNINFCDDESNDELNVDWYDPEATKVNVIQSNKKNDRSQSNYDSTNVLNELNKSLNMNNSKEGVISEGNINPDWDSDSFESSIHRPFVSKMYVTNKSDQSEDELNLSTKSSDTAKTLNTLNSRFIIERISSEILTR